MDAVGFHDLVRLAKDGDRKAMDQVLELLHPHIERLARPYADPSRAAESTSDLLQESCLRAWLKLPTFEGGQDDEQTFAMFRAWVGQIVKRVGLNAQRERKTQKRSPPKPIFPLRPSKVGDSTSAGGSDDPPAREASPSAYARVDELTKRVHAAVEAIDDPKTAAILRMHLFDQINLAQISKRLGLGYDQVRDRYLGAVKRLERDLDAWL